MKRYFASLPVWLAGCMIWLAACSGDGGNATVAATDNAADSAATDSDAIKLAVVPTADCLPLYYAAERGFFKQMGVSVCLQTFDSQMDCDTAIARGWADVGYTDLTSAIMAQQKQRELKVVAATTGNRWAVVACGSLRLRNATQLKLRTLAISRFTTADMLAAQLLDSVGIAPSDALCPQINDLYLRTAMLDEAQIDAAVLPEPFVTLARLSGHKVLHTFGDTLRTGCLVAALKTREDKTSDKGLTAVLRAYNMATDSLNDKNNGGAKRCRNMLIKTLKLPVAIADSLRLPHYAHAALPADADIEAARRFLVKRSLLKRNAAVAGLTDGQYCEAARK